MNFKTLAFITCYDYTTEAHNIQKNDQEKKTGSFNSGTFQFRRDQFLL